jgi:hypothetical protein
METPNIQKTRFIFPKSNSIETRCASVRTTNQQLEAHKQQLDAPSATHKNQFHRATGNFTTAQLTATKFIELKKLPVPSGEQPLDIDEEDLPLASEITTRRLHVLLEQVQQSHRQKEELEKQLANVRIN